jgi:hypothetical protein
MKQTQIGRLTLPNAENCKIKEYPAKNLNHASHQHNHLGCGARKIIVSCSWLKPEPERSPFALLAHFVEKAGDGLLLHEAGAVEVFAHGERQLVFTDATLGDDMMQLLLLRIGWIAIEVVQGVFAGTRTGTGTES